MDVVRGGDDESEDRGNFQNDHGVVRLGRFSNPAHQDHGQDHYDQERRDVKAEVQPGFVEHVAFQISQPGRQIGGGYPAQRGMPTEPVEHIDQVGGETYADSHVADCVFKDQIPAYDPGDQLAHSRVGV